MTKQDTIKEGKSPHIKTGQGNPVGGKESPKELKESENLPLC